jgi:hypothetical protein
MEEIGKKNLVAAGIVVAGLVYFLVCAFPLQKELILAPVWTRTLAGAPETSISASQTAKGRASPSIASDAIAFRLGDTYGYFTPEGSLLFASKVSYGVALANDAFAPYERLSEGFAIQSPGGATIARVPSVGYPFFAGGRRFVIGPDQATVAELAPSGEAAWTYRFSSIITAFDASPAIAVFGLMDGSVVGLDGSGAATLNFAPGGSRIAGVYGVAASPDGLLVAAITGLDKQRLVVLEKRSAAYRVTYHRYLASDYRRPVSISFTADGRRIAYESPAGVGVYDRATRSETVISVPASPPLGLTTREGGLMVLLSGSSGTKRLVCVALPDRRIVDTTFLAKIAFVETRGDSLFLGVDDDIVRMDLRER